MRISISPTRRTPRRWLKSQNRRCVSKVAYVGRARRVEGYRNRKPSPHYLERAIDDLDAESVLYVGCHDVFVELTLVYVICRSKPRRSEADC